MHYLSLNSIMLVHFTFIFVLQVVFNIVLPMVILINLNTINFPSIYYSVTLYSNLVNYLFIY